MSAATILALSQLVAALSASGLGIFTAVQKANALTAQGTEPTPEQWAELDAALKAALDASAIYEAQVDLRRQAALAAKQS